MLFNVTAFRIFGLTFCPGLFSLSLSLSPSVIFPYSERTTLKEQDSLPIFLVLTHCLLPVCVN